MRTVNLILSKGNRVIYRSNSIPLVVSEFQNHILRMVGVLITDAVKSKISFDYLQFDNINAIYKTDSLLKVTDINVFHRPILTVGSSEMIYYISLTSVNIVEI